MGKQKEGNHCEGYRQSSFRSLFARIWRLRPVRFIVIFLLALYPMYFASAFFLSLLGGIASAALSPIDDGQFMAVVVYTAIALSGIFAWWASKPR